MAVVLDERHLVCPELIADGVVGFAAWLGVHSLLMTGVRNRIDAFVEWGWDYFSTTRGPQVLDRSDAARIDWGDDPASPGLVPTGWPRNGERRAHRFG